MLWLRFVLSCLLWLSCIRPAFAETVVLLRPSNHSPATTELLERLRGELLSIGFEVVVRARPESTGTSVSESWQNMLSAEAHCDAALDIVGEPPIAVDVWVIDGAQNFELLTRVKVDANSENHSKGLAIRASEVLRARLQEPHADKEQQRPIGAAPSSSVQPVAVSPQGGQHAGRVGFELGAVAFTSLDGVGPGVSPLLRFNWVIASNLVLQTTLAGFGTRPNIDAPVGKAQVAMQYGLLGACYQLNWQQRVHPLAAVSLGALHTSVDGQAEPPSEGHFVEQWSFLVDASLGVAFQLSQRYAMVLAGHAQVAEPYVAIQLGDRRVASLGRPNLLVSLTFGAWP